MELDMNDELFDRSLHTFTTVTKGAETQHYRDVLLSDGTTVRLRILDSGNMTIFYRPGDKDSTTRIGHFYFANDETISVWSRPHSFVLGQDPVTRERLYEVIMAESQEAFMWCVWNLS